MRINAGRVSANRRATIAVPTTLATTITTTPRVPWPQPISHNAASFTGTSSSEGRPSTISAAHGGSLTITASTWRTRGQRPMRAIRRCSGSQPHSSNSTISATSAPKARLSAVIKPFISRVRGRPRIARARRTKRCCSIASRISRIRFR